MFFKKWKQYKQVKKIVKDVENFEQKCKLASDKYTIQKYVDELVDSYNKVNKIHIPKDLVGAIYKLALSASNGKLKNGDAKKEIALELIKALLGIAGKLAEFLLHKAVFKIFGL